LVPDGFYRGHCIDALFQSLARHAGQRTIGVILSGMRKDGSLGLRAIKEAGGIALVQSPEEAAYPDMPQNAIEYDGSIDFIGPIDVIAEEICRRVGAAPAHSMTATTSKPGYPAAKRASPIGERAQMGQKTGPVEEPA
jgi:hypothetical protein